MTGLPGQVGPASRAIWCELKPLLADEHRAFAVWPFDGSLSECTTTKRVVLAEIYPKVSYGISLGAELPSELLSLKKNLYSARSKALASVRSSHWFQKHSVVLEEDTRALDGADDFDAAFSALALLRLNLAGSLLDGSAYEDSRREGGILGIRHALLSRAGSAGPPRVPA